MMIRNAQMREFEHAEIKRFENFMVAHLREYLPDHFHAISETGTREAIRDGIERSRAYHILSEPGVAVFIRMMFVFGPDFDKHYAWAVDALRHSVLTDESDMIVRLTAAATVYLQSLRDVSGND